MAGLLNISEPNANNHNHNHTDTTLNNQNASHDFLATLATDATNTKQQAASKHSREQIAQLFDLPLMDLLLQAQTIHRQHFTANEVQISTDRKSVV